MLQGRFALCDVSFVESCRQLRDGRFDELGKLVEESKRKERDDGRRTQ
jgi:hypothetical protein